MDAACLIWGSSVSVCIDCWLVSHPSPLINSRQPLINTWYKLICQTQAKCVLLIRTLHRYAKSEASNPASPAVSFLPGDVAFTRVEVYPNTQTSLPSQEAAPIWDPSVPDGKPVPAKARVTDGWDQCWWITGASYIVYPPAPLPVIASLRMVPYRIPGPYPGDFIDSADLVQAPIE